MCSKGVQIQADTVFTSLGSILSGPADFDGFKLVINRFNSS